MGGSLKYRHPLRWQETLGGFETYDTIARWHCKGCGAWSDLDRGEYLARCDPSYVMWNELSVCNCGAPRTLHCTTGAGTPLRPNNDEWLWISKELGYGTDPEAWFTIEFMLDW